MARDRRVNWKALSDYDSMWDDHYDRSERSARKEKFRHRRVSRRVHDEYLFED